MGSVPPLFFAGTALVCLGDLLHIIGLGTPNWEKYEGRFREDNQGLFKYCIDDNCYSYESSELEAVQAMTVIGMLIGLVAAASVLVYVILNLISKSPPKILMTVCTVASIGTLIFIIIGVIVLHAVLHEPELVYDFSFGLCITGAILLGIGGVLVFMGSKAIG